MSNRNKSAASAVANVSLIALGISEVRRGSDIVEGGVAHIAEGVSEGWFSPLKWSYGSDDSEVTGFFNLGDFYKAVRKPNGEEDTKAKSAKWLALAENYGIDGELTEKDKVAFQRGYTLAAAKFIGVPLTFETVKVKRGKKADAVEMRAAVVPASVAFKLRNEEGKPTEIASNAMDAQKSNLRLFNQPVPEDAELLAMVEALPVECVGGRHGLFGKVPPVSDLANKLRSTVVEAGLMPAPKQRNTEKRAQQFVESLDFIVKALDLLASTDESEFAPNDKLEAKMRDVAERIEAYFAALPEQEQEQEEIQF